MRKYNHVYTQLLTEGECVTEVRITDAPPVGEKSEKIKALWSTASEESLMTPGLARELGLTILPFREPTLVFMSGARPSVVPEGRVEVCLYLDDDDPLFAEFVVIDDFWRYPYKDLVLGMDLISQGELEIRHNGSCPVLNFFYNIKE